MKKPCATSACGFTLIEISIVIVIISLIIAGIMTGRSMIEASNLQAVVADFDQYRKAAMLYKEKYGELPGDHSAATAITSADAGCPTPAASNNSTTATCNGNGDGFIGNATGAACGAITTYQETLLVWQHLANDGFIISSYNGRRSTAANEITIGLNVPQTKITNASFMLAYHPGTTGGGCAFFTSERGHALFFGKTKTSAALPFLDAALTPDQAKSIDLKMDDGKPGLGKLITLPNNVMANCVTTSEATTAAYTAGTTPACSLIFFTGF